MKTEEQIFNEYMKVNYPFLNKIPREELNINGIKNTYQYQAYSVRVRFFELLNKICSLFIK